MNMPSENLVGVPRPVTGVRRGKTELLEWAGQYSASVGPAAEGCAGLISRLLETGSLDDTVIDRLLELLEILEKLSADPVTISCAVVHVASLGGAVRAEILDALPGQVRKQLEELNKLKHYESGQSESGTERSAEGLRRLLLALVNDVRVVLIDLSWQLVLLRRAREDTELAE
ncbi:MAG: HD domain-containing protein, partial [Xanthomonadales bacterium]|nr:HD domain-containing protein [Xanthomonadales bacterium]